MDTNCCPEENEETAFSSYKSHTVRCENQQRLKNTYESENQKLDIIDNSKPSLLYNVSDRPPLYLLAFFSFQQALVALPSTMTVAFIVADVACVGDNKELRTKLLGSSLFMSGITTLLMVTIGIRIPLFQGAGGMYIIPLMALEAAEPDRCVLKETVGSYLNSTGVNTTFHNGTMDKIELTMFHIRAMQGSLMLAGLLHSLVGVTGIVGVLLKIIGPITIVPALLLTGIFIVKIIIKYSRTHWGIAFATSALAIILSLFLAKKKTPIPLWTRKKGFHILWYPLHQVFSLLIALLFGWMLSAILTNYGILSSDPESSEFMARTDSRSQAIHTSSWFSVPYPGQFGWPSFNVGVFIAYLVGSLMSVLDSIGDYHACAATCRVPPPPSHAVNRGIAVEGFCSALSGAVGCGHATSTYGINTGAIGVTKVASRMVFIGLSITFMLFGLIGKFSAVFISIPYPVLGGLLLSLIGMFIGVVLSNLQVINLNSTRNVAIIGISLIVGLMLPRWIETDPDGISTGNKSANTIIKILLSNPNLTGGGLACFLDNLVPGTKEERGITAWSEFAQSTEESNVKHAEGYEVYEPVLPQRIKSLKIMKYIPFLPYRPTKYIYEMNEIKDNSH